MYQIITETRVNGNREMDSVSTKIYSKKGFAERSARNNSGSFTTPDGKLVERKAYVRGFLNPASQEEAKVAYYRCKSIWIDGKYGHVKIRNSWEYGSHAPAAELFYRSVSNASYYGYKGNYYIEYER